MSEQTSLTLFFAVAAVALIGAVNSRGIIRAVISYVLAFACLVLATLHTYHYVARQNAAMDILTTPSGAPPPDLSSSAAASDTEGLTAEERAAHNLMAAQGQNPDAGQQQVQGDAGENSNQTAAPASNPGSNSPATMGSTSSDLRKITREARRLQTGLSAINLSGVGQMSDAEYTRIQASARQYATQAQSLQTHMATLAASPPVGQEENLQTLTSAVGYLVSASRDLQRFFNSENTADEKMHAAGFRNGVQAAGVALQRVESRMGGSAE